MLVVVAGGAGFLGASLVDRLQAEGDEVVVVDDLSHGHLANLTEARRRGGVRFHRMDVGQGGLATLADRVRADAWVHLATAIDPVRAWEDPTGEARAVVPGAIEVLRAAAATGARAAWTMLQGQPPRVDGDGRQERDFLFVDDAVDAVARAVHASQPPGRVLVGTGTSTSVLDVVEQLAARISWEGEPQWAPPRPGDPRRSALDP